MTESDQGSSVKAAVRSNMAKKQTMNTSIEEISNEAAKMWNHWLLYFVAVTIIPLAHLYCWFANLYKQQYLFFIVESYLLVPAIMFVFIPLLDIVLGCMVQMKPYFFMYFPQSWRTKAIYDKLTSATPIRESKAIYHNILYYYVALHTLTYLISLYHINNYALTDVQFWLHGFSLGVVGVASVAVSHELMHKLTGVDVFLSKYLLTLINYTHFALEHVYGHHKNVATERDPATAKYNQSLYTFIPRSIMLGFLDAFHIEAIRLRMRKISVYNVHHNRMFRVAGVMVLWPILIGLVFGYKAMITHIISSFVAVWFAEAVNFIEHYGLERKKLSDGSYEPVSEKHSWDTPFQLSHYSFLNLMSHSDHHAHPLKDYQNLKTAGDVSPKLPLDYPLLVLLAHIPPVFRRVVHPILDAFKAKDQL